MWCSLLLLLFSSALALVSSIPSPPSAPSFSLDPTKAFATPRVPPPAPSLLRNPGRDALPTTAPTLTLVFLYPDTTLAGRRLFVRGNALGLSWDAGVPLVHSARDQWSISLPLVALAPSQSVSTNNTSAGTAAPAVLECKALIDDAIWQIGANEQVLLPALTTSLLDPPHNAVSADPVTLNRSSSPSASSSSSSPSPSPAFNSSSSLPSPSSPARAHSLALTLSATLYPWFFSRSGQYGYLRGVVSPQLNNTRDLVLYVPPSYFENPYKQYPLLLMHDGQNLFNDSTSFAGLAWRCQDTVDGMVAGGQMQELLIAGVDNTPQRTFELTYSYDPSVQQGGGGDLYLDFLRDTVLGVVRGAVRVRATAGLGLLGSSLGGLLSCYAGYTRAEYARVGCMSSSFWWNSEDFDHVVLAGTSHAASGAVFYVDSGDAGPSLDDVVQTRTVVQHMLRLGFQLNHTLFYYVDRGGQHSELYWGRRFHVPMAALYPPLVTEPQQR